MTRAELREAAGYSKEKAGVESGTCAQTVRVYELAPTAIRSKVKRAALDALYKRFEEQHAPDAASPTP